MRQINTITDENGEEFEIADKECRANKLDKTDLPKELSAFKNDKGFIDKTAANLENYYTTADTYTRAEIDEFLSSRLNFEVVGKLPTKGISLSTIYLVSKPSGGNGKSSDKYDEYIYANGKWELIGDTDIDLSNYYTKEETDERIRELSESGEAANQELLQGLNALKTNLGSEVSDRKAADDDLGARLVGVEKDLSAASGTASDNKARLDGLAAKIPAQASAANQLADKNFVNSSIATNTANYIGNFDTLAALEAYSGTLTNNDYAFVTTTDAAGNVIYKRYKYNSTTSAWGFEYDLNNTGFTAAQMAAINSGITASMIPSGAGSADPLAKNSQITELDTKITNGLNSKQNKFNDVLARTDLTSVISDVSEYCENLKVIGMKRSGIIFLEISFTSNIPVSWHTQNLFTLTDEKWYSAYSGRLPLLAAYYKEGEILMLMNPLIDGNKNIKIGENNAAVGGEIRGMLIYPALNP